MKKLALVLALLPTLAFAEDAKPALEIPPPLAPSDPLLVAQNMMGAMAGQVARLQAELNDANRRVAQLEGMMKNAAVQDARPK